MAGDRRVLFANSLYHLTNDGAATVFAGQITVLQFVFRLGPLETGILSGTALLTTAAFQVLVGALSDRWDPSRFLPLGIVILGVGSLLVATAWSFLALLLIITISRIGASFYHPVGIAWIGREFQGEDLDRSMGFQSAFGDSGVILGIGTSALIAVAWGWQSPFLLWGGINLAAVAVGLWLVRGRPSPPQPSPVRPSYLRIVRDVRLWLFPLGLGGAAFSIFTTFGPPMMKDKFGLSDAGAGISIAIWILAGAVVAFFFGRVSQRFGRFRALVASYGFIAIACVAGAAIADAWVVLLLFWTLGSAVFVTYPALFSFVSEASHRRLQGATFGVIFGVQLLGASLGAFSAGVAADRLRDVADLESTAPFYLLGALALAGFLYLLANRRRIPESRRLGVPRAPAV